MKKILLGTTAIAAAALYAQSAQAQITVSLGGYTEFFGAYYDDDVPAAPAANSSSRRKSSSAPTARPTTVCSTVPRSSCRTPAPAAASATDEASVWLVVIGEFEGVFSVFYVLFEVVGEVWVVVGYGVVSSVDALAQRQRGVGIGFRFMCGNVKMDFVWVCGVWCGGMGVDVVDVDGVKSKWVLDGGV